ncbi:MAG: PaaI family thioesterase [Acidimicrobiales bacterium]
MTAGAGQADLPPEAVDLAAAVRRLGDELLTREVDPGHAAKLAATLTELRSSLERFPSRTKVESFASTPGHNRVEHFVRTGEWPQPPPDGSEIVFDALSFVGGALNSCSAGVEYHRDGDVAVATATFSPTFEGPPSRVHGGMLAATFDEVMGTVFRVRGMASSFTGTLAVRYLAPAPLGVELEFRAWLQNTEGRKHFIEASASGPDGLVAEASGTFIQMTREQFAEAVGAANS